MDQTDIDQNLKRVQERIAEAALRSHRKPDSIQLVAISKSHPARLIQIAYECGQRQFGENRVVEAFEKQVQLRALEGIRWHMVGRIQSRKAKDAAGRFEFVHSIDRPKIARRLDQYQGEHNQILKVFLEVNTSGEDTKAGWDLVQKSAWDQFLEQVSSLLQLPNLEFVGLMTMAALDADENDLHGTFSRLREVRDFLEKGLSCKLPELSMGMTDDFEIAIEEGATVVRIGRAIFGPRA